MMYEIEIGGKKRPVQYNVNTDRYFRNTLNISILAYLDGIRKLIFGVEDKKKKLSNLEKMEAINMDHLMAFFYAGLRCGEDPTFKKDCGFDIDVVASWMSLTEWGGYLMEFMAAFAASNPADVEGAQEDEGEPILEQSEAGNG